MADRVSFAAHNAADLDAEERYDLACVFEALHDMGEVGARRGIRALLAHRFTAPEDEIERFMYGWSVLHCLPDWATQADFARAEALPIDHDFWRFYRLDA